MSAVWGMARSRSVALVGMEAMVVDVEAWTGAGLPRTTMVGLPDAALTQAKERCRAAVLSAGFRWPTQVLTINLTPASLPKTGSHYDLGIAAAVLATEGVVPHASLEAVILLGELGLDGQVHAVRGVLPALLGARRIGLQAAIVPAVQLNEARLVEGHTVRGVRDLAELIGVLKGGQGSTASPPDGSSAGEEPESDLRDVVGLTSARWALEVAAAGRHHMFLHGPPGVGKTLLASCLPTILPDLTVGEAMEVAAIHSLVDTRIDRLPRRAPYCAPHHTASTASLIGGGARVARPGAISLAHRGVLFLDEAPEFSSQVLEGLRTPLESGQVVLSRSEMTVCYPARFQLVLAANPCPCGLVGVPRSSCSCTPMAVRRYSSRLSGPILDRVDISARILPVRQGLTGGGFDDVESSATVRSRVEEARNRQSIRLRDTQWTTNAEVSGRFLRKELPAITHMGVLERAVAAGKLSARGVDKVIRIAWTVADLAGARIPDADHLAAAMALRQGERAQ